MSWSTIFFHQVHHFWRSIKYFTALTSNKKLCNTKDQFFCNHKNVPFICLHQYNFPSRAASKNGSVQKLKIKSFDTYHVYSFNFRVEIELLTSKHTLLLLIPCNCASNLLSCIILEAIKRSLPNIDISTRDVECAFANWPKKHVDPVKWKEAVGCVQMRT